MPRDFEIVETAENGQEVIHAVGELDLANVPKLRNTLKRSERTHSRTVLDLSKLTFIDSTGIQFLIEAKRGTPGGRTLELRNPSAVALATLRLAGVLPLLGLSSTKLQSH